MRTDRHDQSSSRFLQLSLLKLSIRQIRCLAPVKKKVFSRLFEHVRLLKAYTVLGTLQESHFCSKSVPYHIFVTILSNQAILARVCAAQPSL